MNRLGINSKWQLFYLLLLVILLLPSLFSCKKNTPKVIPTITTAEVIKITPNTVTCGGYVVAEGDAAVTMRGVCWSTAQCPTLIDNITTDGKGRGVFTSHITGLKPETTYYVRAYAINKAGTVYGEQRVLITSATDPKITNTVISDVTTVTAKLDVNIQYYDASQMLEYGICWSTSNTPTVNNENTSLSIKPDSVLTDYSFKMTQLESNKTYYARAFAFKNSSDIYYGNIVSFTTKDNRGPTVTDIDGNVYHTVTIGTQTWMVENLKTTRYRNGDSIANVTVFDKWPKLTTGAFTCWGRDLRTIDEFGLIYNWYAINDNRKIAPIGWHVPTDAEWRTLIEFLGGTSVAGGKLKETGFKHWSPPFVRWDGNVPPATNDWGFSALGGGALAQWGNSNEYSIGYGGIYGYWWAANEYNSVDAWYTGMRYNSITAGTSNAEKWEGLSVRCLKD